MKKLSTLMNFLIALLLVALYGLHKANDISVEPEKPTIERRSVSENTQNESVLIETTQLQEDLSYTARLEEPLIKAMIDANLNVDIMRAWIKSIDRINTKDDVFGMNVSDPDYKNQVEYFIKKTGIMKNGVQQKAYVSLYEELYGKDNLRNLYNVYQKLYNKNLR